ncbi:MAG TPA: RloB family protein [Verrucomicrobiota bacterium]|jgi:hypothetical protein|nr:RloB family protein [Verrucomicrobiota bacterium]OQC63397.1 MAG: hypothetical protein BWX48_03239 [Verrucomicrobia bacterium ADurb.Bin006]HPG01300.1 RloB family protein [Kiritimatiellia bacterium]NMD19740.1 RloB domain-containing protein [Verrucomicrobiota bacterium]HNU99049.1 RloB family protein [Verrucomicrobiota bacterium]
MSKPWERAEGYRRREDTRVIRNRILIVCEGEKTEPNYFRKFSVDIDLVEVDVQGIGANTLSLVGDAVARRDDASREGTPYNQVWCVFDRDVFPAGNFNEAFRLARTNRIRVAYSNQCFELWYFLHFNFSDAALHRQAYGDKLTGLLGRKYQKNDTKMYDLLKDRQATAMQNARKLLTRYVPCNPEKHNGPRQTTSTNLKREHANVDNGTTASADGRHGI